MAHNEQKTDLSGVGYAPPPQNPPPYNNQTQPGLYPAVPSVAPAPPQQFVTVVPAQQMGPEPTNTSCPSCSAAIVTRVDHVPVTKTHLFALLLCLIGCCPCACIPYCTDSCKDANHYCPNCNAYIGSYNR
ncbi:lipopolysaccharide-induced tumor necrosis factor-alpha factor homolog [Bombyx mori]|uniref:LITAF domain-containing protein n=1 Tax=Bombyx mori TaxID=7091 RepID=A0A8R2MBI6_BOMMO|nr:lipopolysaccharide-induced tumor necrosis factor-alpha factor homolog [Bombyx mori]